MILQTLEHTKILTDYISSDGSTVNFIGGYDLTIDIVDALKTAPNIKKVNVFIPEEAGPIRAYNYQRLYLKLEQYCRVNDIELAVVSGSVKHELNTHYFGKNTNSSFSWDTCWGFNVIQHAYYRKIRPVEQTEIKKLFINMNRRPRIHRALLMDYLYKEDLLNDGHVSWYPSNEYGEYKFKFWTEETLALDEISYSFDFMLPPEHYKDSLWSIVGETLLNEIFITEKTWMPVYHLRPFLVFSAPNFHAYLKVLGFKLFDEFVDYSFDSISNNEERCIALVNEIKKLKQYDFYEIKSRLLPKLIHNHNNLISLVKNKVGIPKVDLGFLSHNEIGREYLNLMNIGNQENFDNFFKKGS